ncbi:MAG: hypothetical protein ACYTG0_19505 [Planctomycetota bacterium]|jgi:hypothetical protein
MPIDWHKNQPILHYMRRILPLHFPFFTELGYALHHSGIGGYNNRERRQGGFSAHSQGRAADIFLDAKKAYEKLLGDRLFDMFGNNMAALGVDHVIWDTRLWSTVSLVRRPINPQADGIGMHRDHVHVAFTENGSQQMPPLLESLLTTMRATLDLEIQQAATKQQLATRRAAQKDARPGPPVMRTIPSVAPAIEPAFQAWISPYESKASLAAKATNRHQTV